MEKETEHVSLSQVFFFLINLGLDFHCLRLFCVI